ncbi:MAG TPA: acyl-CoA thioesterase [Holosporales bacterium]|nr:acyl-CoA thioesterase [Holosporales bacterium]
MTLKIRHKLKAQFFDCDAMGVVWHGNYVKYFEEARDKFLDLIHYSYQQMEQSGYVWPVVDLQIKYIKPIILGQEFTVEATLLEYENRFKLDFRLYDTDEKLLTKGHCTQVAVKAGHNTLELRTPAFFQEKIKKALR